MGSFLENTRDSMKWIAPEFSKIVGAVNQKFELFDIELKDALRTGRAPNFASLQSVLSTDSLKENQVPNDNNNLQKCSAQVELIVPLVKTKQEKLSKVPENDENTNKNDATIVISKASNNDEITNKNDTTIVISKKPTLKKEKLSNVSEQVDVKPENKSDDLTFAVPQLPLKVKKIKKEPVQSTRITRSKRKQESVLVQPIAERESDIIVQDPHVSIVDLLSSDDEDKEPVKQSRGRSKKVTKKVSERASEVERETRSTRTKTKLANKRYRNSDEEIETEKKKSRSCSNEKSSNANCSTHSVYQDALSTLDNKVEAKTTSTSVTKPNVNDVTFNVSNKPPLNQTFDVNHAKQIVEDKIHKQEQDLLTDDESFEEPKTKMLPKSATRPKQLFSPHGNTPLKEKVKAFEQLASNIPVKHKIGTPDNVRTQSKNITPITSKQLLKINTLKTTPVAKASSTKNSLSVLSAKSTSAMKASQAEYIRRKEREQEALKKREALLMAQSEEKRKKREERQLRAQQQREANEKEKQKQFELQKQKYEAYQQVIAEKERKILKAREENERKRLLAKKKVLEQKEHEKNIIPKYKTYKAPLLPVEDCYDSDDERYTKTKRRLPSWAQEPELNLTLQAQLAIGDKIKNTFFSCMAQTPNLEELFGIMDPGKLKRTSSAIWNTPPRFTQLHSRCPTIEGSDEDN